MLTRACWLSIGCLFWIARTDAFARPQVTSASPAPQVQTPSDPSVSPSTPDEAQEELEEMEEIEELEEEVGDRDPTYLRTRLVFRYDYRLFIGDATANRLRLRVLYRVRAEAAVCRVVSPALDSDGHSVGDGARVRGRGSPVECKLLQQRTLPDGSRCSIVAANFERRAAWRGDDDNQAVMGSRRRAFESLPIDGGCLLQEIDPHHTRGSLQADRAGRHLQCTRLEVNGVPGVGCRTTTFFRNNSHKH